MDQVCEFCGTVFEGPPQARFCQDAHRQAFRRARDSGTPTELEEQEIRDRFGYSSSETRTQAERALAAQRMIEEHR